MNAMTRRLVVLLAMSFVPSVPLLAQIPTPTALRASGAPAFVAAQAPPVHAASGKGIFLGVRLLTGLLGASLGLATGAFLGGNFLPRGDCGDDPGLCEAILGGITGLVAGAGIGAALPQGRSTCTTGKRIMTGLLGSTAGGIGVILVARREGRVFVAFSVGSIAGGAVGAELCRGDAGS
jgi:hypothetical protein